MATHDHPPDTSASGHHESQIRNRRRSIRLLRNEIACEESEEKRFALAAAIEKLEADADDRVLDDLRPTQH